MYKVGQIIRGVTKDCPDASVKVNFLIINLRPNKYDLVNIPSCITLRYFNDSFQTLEELNKYVNEAIDIKEVNEINNLL